MSQVSRDLCYLWPVSFSYRVYAHDETHFRPPYHRVACNSSEIQAVYSLNALLVSLSDSSIPVNSKLFLSDLISRSINLLSWRLNWSSIVHIMTPSSLITWWRHQMETFSALLAICAGNSPVPAKILSFTVTKTSTRHHAVTSCICK